MWFCGKDVCLILGYKRTANTIADKLKQKNKKKLIDLYDNENEYKINRQH
jgi:prophage antirepressor-like protein